MAKQAKKKIEVFTTEKKFKEALKNAGQYNKVIKETDKQLKEIKVPILKYMEDNSIQSEEIDGFKTTLVTTNKSSMDEDAVIAIIQSKFNRAKSEQRKQKLQSALKQVITIDTDALEELLDEGIITRKELEPTITEKVSTSLRLTYKK